MIKNYSGFTLIETLLTVMVIATLMVTVGGVMTMSFKAKNTGESNEAMSSRAGYVLGELKKNILDAQIDKITCPVSVGTSISFVTKSGGSTTLLCDEATGQIASSSANGTLNYLDDNVRVQNCENFVRCTKAADLRVMSVGFSLDLSSGETNGVSNSQIFYGVVAPRE